MKDSLVSKSFVCTVILLFLGVAVAPSINSFVVKTSDDLVEVTSQACGIQGFRNTQKKTVSLSAAECHQLEEYLDEFQMRLNTSCSLDETKSLFKEALQKLDSFGLLPHGVSPELVYFRICRNLPKHTPRSPVEFGRNQVKNYCCFVTGKATMVWYQRLLFDLLTPIFSLFIYTPILLTYLPIGIGLVVSFGLENYYVNYPSIGSIYTYGINGQYSNNGSFWGTLPLPRFWVYPGFTCVPGLLGFTGIHIWLPNGSAGEDFFIGFTLVARYNVSTPSVRSIS